MQGPLISFVVRVVRPFFRPYQNLVQFVRVYVMMYIDTTVYMYLDNLGRRL